MKNLFLGMMFLMMLAVTSCGGGSKESTEAVATDSTEVVIDSTAVEVSDSTAVEASAEKVSE